MFPHFRRTSSYRENAKEELSPQQYHEAFNRLVIFPGDDKLYEKTVGYEIEAIDTQQNNKGVQIILNANNQTVDVVSGGHRLRNHLVDNGVEAIVNAQLISRKHVEVYFGLPVRRKPRL